jgi:hypothetical protein
MHLHLNESALVERPPHPDPLPASGEREQTCTLLYPSGALVRS